MVSDSTLTQDIWTIVKNTLVNNIYIVNSATTTTVMASVNAAYNDKNTTRPQVVIYPVQYSESARRFGGRYGPQLINVEIECYAGSSMGVDQMADKIRELMSVTEIDGTDLVGISTNYIYNDYNQTKFHTKGFVFTYQRD
jgi:hypothetical protein